METNEPENRSWYLNIFQFVGFFLLSMAIAIGLTIVLENLISQVPILRMERISDDLKSDILVLFSIFLAYFVWWILLQFKTTGDLLNNVSVIRSLHSKGNPFSNKRWWFFWGFLSLLLLFRAIREIFFL